MLSERSFWDCSNRAAPRAAAKRSWICCMPHSGNPSLIGIDLNATRVRAVWGTAGAPPQGLLLDGTNEELPLALSLENRHIEVGTAGLGLCRRLPHLACIDFLAGLGADQQWSAGRHRIDATRALGIVFEHLRPILAGHQGIALALPAYLSTPQLELITATA